MNDSQQIRDKLQQLLQILGSQLIERESLVQLIVLAMVAREHLLVLGPPGTAKSAAVRAVAKAFRGNYFEYILGRFSEPSELFGPIDLRKLKEGIVETETSRMLPEADIAFLDEVFLGSTAILNTLLGILNERRFKRGHTDMPCPLRICVAASNALPDEPALAAFADRFLVRIHVESLPDSELEHLLQAGWIYASQPKQVLPEISLSELDLLSESVLKVNMTPIQGALAHCVRLLRKAGILLSDRRLVKAQSLIAASAVLNGVDCASEQDLWPLVYVVTTPQEQQQAREILQLILQQSANSVLPQAVSLASVGPLARAQTIQAKASRLLENEPSTFDAQNLEAWTLKCEALLREIDAGFFKEQLPSELAVLREKLAHSVGATAEVQPPPPEQQSP